MSSVSLKIKRHRKIDRRTCMSVAATERLAQRHIFLTFIVTEPPLTRMKGDAILNKSIVLRGERRPFEKSLPAIGTPEI